MTSGKGTLLSDYDEEGNDLPFLTTDQILEQLAKFGFYIYYDVKSNLPSETIDILQSMYELGYDKITKVLIRMPDKSGKLVWREKTVVIRSEQCTDLLAFGAKLSKAQFDDKLEADTLRNLTDKEVSWDWLTYIANISDILDENIDPKDEYETETDVEEGEDYYPPGFTPYEDSDEEIEEDSDDSELQELEGDSNGTE